MTVKTNDLKTGVRIQLRNGWFGTLKDNTRQNTRVAEVEGFETEIGSVYAHDIVAALVGDKWEPVEHTPSQLKLKKQTEAFGW